MIPTPFHPAEFEHRVGGPVLVLIPGHIALESYPMLVIGNAASESGSKNSQSVKVGQRARSWLVVTGTFNAIGGVAWIRLTLGSEGHKMRDGRWEMTDDK